MVQKNPHAVAIQTMLALAAAIVVGMLMKTFVPDTVNTTLNDNIFSSISTMFLNALKMIVGPVVFFSIVSSISQFGDLKEVGRIGGKIMGFYMLTTVLAILSSTGIFYVFQPGDPRLASKLTADVSAIASSDVSISIKDTIVNIIPSNFVKPFLESNMLDLWGGDQWRNAVVHVFLCSGTVGGSAGSAGSRACVSVSIADSDAGAFGWNWSGHGNGFASGYDACHEQ